MSFSTHGKIFRQKPFRLRLRLQNQKDTGNGNQLYILNQILSHEVIKRTFFNETSSILRRSTNIQFCTLLKLTTPYRVFFCLNEIRFVCTFFRSSKLKNRSSFQHRPLPIVIEQKSNNDQPHFNYDINHSDDFKFQDSKRKESQPGSPEARFEHTRNNHEAVNVYVSES